MKAEIKVILKNIYGVLGKAIDVFLVYDWFHFNNIKTKELAKRVNIIGEELIKLAEKLRKY